MQSIIRIPMPEWFNHLSGDEKIKCMNDLDCGKEINVDVEYNDNGIIISAKYMGATEEVRQP